MDQELSCNTVFNGQVRLQKALDAFWHDPTGYNTKRIISAVRAIPCEEEVAVKNAMMEFVQSISTRPRYAVFVDSFNDLLE